jgi:hypothetical protein
MATGDLFFATCLSKSLTLGISRSDFVHLCLVIFAGTVAKFNATFVLEVCPNNGMAYSTFGLFYKA